MARKAKKSFISNSVKNLQKETVRGIVGVIFFILAALLILAAAGKAGVIGSMLFRGLSYISGVGYFLFPVLLISLGFAFFKKTENDVALWQIVGAIIFFVAGLGLIELGFDTRGGVVGSLVAAALVPFFDIVVTALILVGVIIISTFLIFDTAAHAYLVPKFLISLFKRRSREDDDEREPKIVGAEALKQEERMAAKKLAEKRGDDNDDEDDENDENEEDELKVVAPPEERSSRGAFGANVGAFSGAFFPFANQKPYVPPPLSLLELDKGKPGVGDIKANSNIIKRTLQNFGIDVEMDEISIGPSVTRYSLKPAEGVKLSKIVGLNNDLALALAAHPIRIEAPIPGKSLVGIEIPNSIKTTVGLGTLLGNDEFGQSEKPLMVALGKSVSGRSHYANIAKMPHMLIAGATGSGKSVTIHALITSLLYRNSPENLKFIMIDPKRVELTLYNNIPHLLSPVITDPKKAILSLKWAAKEMERRYDVLEQMKVRDLESYHKNILKPALAKIATGKKPAPTTSSGTSGEMNDSENGGETLPETMPYIVIIIDELADIMQTYPRELEASIVRLAQMSRAVGIHLMLSTQRPSVNVITGLIKANIPTRIALQVASQVDSRTILDMAGAEKLLGAGDMLFMSADMSKPQRLQSAFISEKEVKAVADYLKDNYKDEVQAFDITADVKSSGGRDPLFDSFDDDGGDEDDLYEEAREIVMKAGKASTSYLQRKLRIGYARAARLIDMLEERGVVSGGSGAKPRDVLVGAGSAEAEGFGNETDET